MLTIAESNKNIILFIKTIYSVFSIPLIKLLKLEHYWNLDREIQFKSKEQEQLFITYMSWRVLTIYYTSGISIAQEKKHAKHASTSPIKGGNKSIKYSGSFHSNLGINPAKDMTSHSSNSQNKWKAVKYYI